jgi:hypothetical protein
MSLILSPPLLARLKQMLMTQGRGILGGRRAKSAPCPKGTKLKSVKFKACKKGKGVILGGCECCMGQGCMNCIGRGVLGGYGTKKGAMKNKYIQCLKKSHDKATCLAISRHKALLKKRKSMKPKLKSAMKKKGSKKAKKKVSFKVSKGKNPIPSKYRQILKKLVDANKRSSRPVEYKMLQKKASQMYQKMR